MNYLVDVNVLSEPTRPTPSPKVVSWLRQNESNLAINTVILGEIRLGILLLPPGKRRNALDGWFQKGIILLTCLPWDAETAMTWATLLADLRRRGNSMPLKDSMIAASALRHNLAIATRNVADFKPSKLRVVNPFA